MFEVVEKPPPPSEMLKKILDRLYLPVESKDFLVEAIRVHPSDFAEMQRELTDKIESDVSMPGPTLFGVKIDVSHEVTPRHYEVVYNNATEKSVVCATAAGISQSDCPDLECLVDAVHAL